MNCIKQRIMAEINIVLQNTTGYLAKKPVILYNKKILGEG